VSQDSEYCPHGQWFRVTLGLGGPREIYLVFVTTSSFKADELRAAAEVHEELGPDYRDAVLESFLDKVGKEIDNRVDARLNGPRQYPLQPAQMQATPPPLPAVHKRARDKAFALAIVSIALGIPLTAIVATNNNGNGNGTGNAGAEFAILLVIWAAIAVINVVYARHKD
jgi:hypothetical protein